MANPRRIIQDNYYHIPFFSLKRGEDQSQVLMGVKKEKKVSPKAWKILNLEVNQYEKVLHSVMKKRRVVIRKIRVINRHQRFLFHHRSRLYYSLS